MVERVQCVMAQLHHTWIFCRVMPLPIQVLLYLFAAKVVRSPDLRLLGAFNLHWYNAYSNLSYSGSLQVQEDALN